MDKKEQAQIPILASIGHVCLQWSLLEMTILAVLAQLQRIPPEEGIVLFGELDLLPRFNRACALAEHHRAPPKIRIQLKDVRDRIRQKTTGLAARRNQAVHGAHSLTENIDEVQLTMVRWSGERRTQAVTLEDLIDLVEQIYEAQQDTYKVFQEIAEWQSRQPA